MTRLNSTSVLCAARACGIRSQIIAHATTAAPIGHARRAAASHDSPGLRSMITAMSGVRRITSWRARRTASRPRARAASGHVQKQRRERSRYREQLLTAARPAHGHVGGVVERQESARDEPRPIAGEEAREQEQQREHDEEREQVADAERHRRLVCEPRDRPEVELAADRPVEVAERVGLLERRDQRAVADLIEEQVVVGEEVGVERRDVEPRRSGEDERVPEPRRARRPRTVSDMRRLVSRP